MFMCIFLDKVSRFKDIMYVVLDLGFLRFVR